MIVILSSIVLILLIVWDLQKVEPPQGQLVNHLAFWSWTSANVLLAVGCICVLSEHIIGWPPSRDGETFLLLGAALRVVCANTGCYRLLTK